MIRIGKQCFSNGRICRRIEGRIDGILRDGQLDQFEGYLLDL